MLDVEAVMIEDVPDVLNLGFDVIAGAVNGFHFFLCLGFVAEP